MGRRKVFDWFVDTKIGDKEAKVLSDGLKVNTTLTALSLCGKKERKGNNQETGGKDQMTDYDIGDEDAK